MLKFLYTSSTDDGANSILGHRWRAQIGPKGAAPKME